MKKQILEFISKLSGELSIILPVFIFSYFFAFLISLFWNGGGIYTIASAFIVYMIFGTDNIIGKLRKERKDKEKMKSLSDKYFK